jgi:hypothetical protein
VLTAAALVGAVVLVVVASAARVRHACLHPPPPVLTPSPGTPRADYCDAVGGSSPWLALAVLPSLALLVCIAATRRRTRWSVAAAVVLACAAVANATVASHLTSSTTI